MEREINSSVSFKKNEEMYIPNGIVKIARSFQRDAAITLSMASSEVLKHETKNL